LKCLPEPHRCDDSCGTSKMCYECLDV
jgi:hypothetical protein